MERRPWPRTLTAARRHCSLGELTHLWWRAVAACMMEFVELLQHRGRRIAKIPYLVSMILLVGACSSSQHSASPTPKPTTTTTRECTHVPIKQAAYSYYGLPAPDGPSIDFLHLGGPTPVIDSRGNTARTNGPSVQRTGPDGTLTLTPGHNGGVVILRGFGDFDGDGRGDLLIETAAVNGVYRYYIVPGTVHAGKYEPATVGVRLDIYKPGAYYGYPAAVGDQNGDGADDVSFGRKLYSGRQLAALRPRDAPPAPFRTLPSDYVGLLQLVASGPQSFVVPAPFSLQVLDSRSDRLLLDAGSHKTDLTEALGNGGQAGGWLVSGKHIVDFEYSTRAGGFIWRWNIDAPCGT